MAYYPGPVVLLDDSDMEAQLLQAPVTRAAERQSVSRAGIMITLAVAAVLGYIACTQAGDGQMSGAATQGFGSKFNDFLPAPSMGRTVTQERSQSAKELMRSVVVSAGAQAMSGVMGVLEEESETSGGMENKTFRWGVYDLQNKSNNVTGAAQQVLKDMLEDTGAVSDGKTPGFLPEADAAMSGLLGALHEIRSQQGDADGGDLPTLGVNPLAALGDGDLVQGQKGDELEDPSASLMGMTGALSAAAEAAGKGAAAKDEDPFAALGAFADAMAKQEEKRQKSDPSDEVMGALTGALSEAEKAAGKADGGDAAGKDVDPFAPLAAFVGALAEQDGKIAGAVKRCQNDDCPEAGLEAGAQDLGAGVAEAERQPAQPAPF